jgi:hypothetical protein
MRPQAVHAVTDLELGGAEQFVIAFAHEQPGNAEGFLFGLLQQNGGETLGGGFLFWAQRGLGHGVSPGRYAGAFPASPQRRSNASKFPPTFQLLTRFL